MLTGCPRSFFSASAGAGLDGESTPAEWKPLCVEDWLLPGGDAALPPIVSSATTPPSSTSGSSASSARGSRRERRIYREVSSAPVIGRPLLAAVRRQAHLHPSRRDANCEQT